MMDHGECQFCGAHVLGWNATDGFHPAAHFCEPRVDILRADYDRLRERAEWAEAEVVTWKKTAFRQDKRVSCVERERDEWHDRCAEAQVQLGIARKERDDLVERVDRLSLELGRCEAQRDEYKQSMDLLAEKAEKFRVERDDLLGRLFRYEHTDQGDGMRYVAEGYHKRIMNDLRQHANRLAEELTWGLEHSASLDDEAEAHSERGHEALAAYRDAYPEEEK